MKELELKQIAPYLPYGLKIKTEKMFVGDPIMELTHENVYDKISLVSFFSFKQKNYKPILRPMSDLHKEIEVNGETFTPAERIKKMYPSDTFSSTSNAAQWSYRIVQKLLEWHFDVYGLIDENLAININEL